jgi:hypothetical protein
MHDATIMRAMIVLHIEVLGSNPTVGVEGWLDLSLLFCRV